MKAFALSLIALSAALGVPVFAAGGTFYEDQAPDTVDLTDLAERAWEPLMRWAEDRELYPRGSASPLAPNRGVLGPKYMEALPMIRVMTGTDRDIAREQAMLAGYDEETGEDGLFYTPPLDQMTEPWASVYGQGRMMLAWMAYYHLTKDEKYLDRIAKMAERMREIAIVKDDYAYYPTELIENAYFVFSIRKSGWKRTDEPRAIHKLREDQPLDMGNREGHQFDSKMGIPAYIGGALRGFPRWYVMSKDAGTLELSEKLVRFLVKPEMWQAFGRPAEFGGAPRAHYSGHLHAHTIALRGILDHAQVVNDRSLMDFVKSGYEWTREFGIAEIGWVPEWTNNNFCEGCQIADVVALAIHLSDLGVGDYWEDVDRTVRNQLIESQQVCDLPDVNGKWAAAATPTMMLDRDGSSCCTPNCAQAVYYAWESIIRFNAGRATVNLLLNRASPWMDVHSYLPYEGKVVLKNKQAEHVAVRIPLWVDKGAVRCRVGETSVDPAWLGNYLLIDALEKDSIVTVEFPMVERTMKVPPLTGTHDGGAGPVHGIEYTIHFKGNTVIDIGPRFDGWNKGKGPKSIVQTYQRDHYRSDQAPMKTKRQYVSDVLIPWQPE